MKSILLIEDDQQLRTLLAESLQRSGWQVFEAADGDKGLKLAQEQHPDAVVCDLLIPRTNGFQICSALRRDPALKQTPIVAISGRGYASNRQMALDAGADEFLSKPVSPVELLGLLAKLLGNHPPLTTRPADSSATWLRFWGVRGSVPVPGPATVIYGGNTSCIEVRADDQIIVLDAGTGIRALGQELCAEFGQDPIELTLLISHTHWDHIQGFPFFQPAYESNNRIRVLGYEGAQGGFKSVFAAQMANPYFPVALGQLAAHLQVEEVKDLEFNLGKVRVRAAFMNHPGICMGYRLDTSRGSIAYMPDNEPFERPSKQGGRGTKSEALAYGQAEHLKMIEFIRGADVLIIDAQYDTEEYEQHRGWGHGCLEDVVHLAIRAEVNHLVLFHHDPYHDDQKVAGMAQQAAELAAGARRNIIIEAAREGQVLVLPERAQAAPGPVPRKKAVA